MTIARTTIYESNTPEVVAEVIDNELVAIHLGSGYYYHGNQTASHMWTLIAHHYTVGEMSETLAKLYKQSQETAAHHLDTFLTKLLHAKLIRKAGKKAQEKLVVPLTLIGAYEPPTLKEHSDMQELLLLDPIHDVGDANWPLTDVK